MAKNLVDTGEVLGLQGLREGFMVLDGQGRIRSVNETLCNLLGVSGQGLLDTSFMDLVSRDTLPAVAAGFRAARARGFGGLQASLRRQAGGWVRLHVSLATLQGQDESMLVAICRELGSGGGDYVLSPGAEWLSAALGAARMGIWEWRAGHDGIIWHELEAVLGIEPGQFDGSFEACFGLVHEEDRERIIKKLRAAKQDLDRGTLRVQCRLRSPTDPARWLEITARLFRDERGGIARMVGTVADISESKRAQQALEQSESDYRLLAEHATDMISRHTPEGVYLYASPASQRLLGYQPTELIGRSAYDLFHPDDLAAIRASHRSVLQQPDVGVVAYRIRRKDGTYTWFETTSTSIRDPKTGAVRALVAASRDVSVRKMVESALRESEERYRSLVNALDEGVTLLDQNARIITANPAAERILGLSAEQLYGRTPLHPDWKLLREDLSPFPDDDLPALRSLRTGEALTGASLGILQDDGSVQWLSVNTVPLFRRGDSKPYAVVTSFNDVTERLQVERERTELLDELRLAATAFESHQGMFITDKAGVILRVNQAFVELTGYSAEQAVGSSWDLLRSKRHPDAFYKAMWRKVSESNSWQGEIFNRCEDGRVLPMWQSVTAVNDDEGKITHYVAYIQDITERKRAEARIEHLAYHDALTNLPNRALLIDRLQQALARAQRHERFGAVLFLDLDDFKTINDSLGHRTGDLLLVEVAERLTGAVRDEDTVARLGGDEFVVLLSEIANDEKGAAREAQAIGDKLCQALAGEFRVEGHVLRLSGSIGIVVFPAVAQTTDDLLRHADIAMYQAKAAGRGTTRFFLPEMQAAATERLLVEGELRRALDEGELELYYQPQIEVATGRLVGGEALLRWRHPQRGLLLPGSFIRVLEESALVVPTGLWVLATTCRDVSDMSAAWRLPDPLPPITVNVSPRQFRQADFVDRVEEAIERAGISAERLAFEVTERVVIQDLADTARKMEALKRIGVQFSIDDFGTGYSSLSYVKRLPLDVVKIDRSFVEDCTVDANDRAIVRAIIAMAQSLDLGVVAEGVETAEQLQFLAEQGCDAYQGFLFSPAVPRREFQGLLEGERRVRLQD